MDKKLISFSVDEIENPKTLQEINDSQFTKVRIKAFSTGVTKHNYAFNEDVLKAAAFSILGKPVLYKYNMWTDDASSHEPDEIQCGFIPKDETDADISFEYDGETGKTFLYVNAYLWKVYQEKLIDILQRDNGVKSVSVEMWLIEYVDNGGNSPIDVKQFIFNGVTILGDDVTPACDGAKMEVVKFSIEDYEKAEYEFKEKLNNSINRESNEDSFLIQKNNINKEELMAEELKNATTESPEVLENAEVVTTTNINVSEYKDTYEDDGSFVSSTSEYHSKSETKVEQVPDDTNTTVTNAEDTSATTTDEETSKAMDNACNDKNAMEEKCGELEVKCSALETELTTLKNSFEALKLENATLTEYRVNKEKESMTLAVECALNDVSTILSQDEIAQWREKSLTCANIDAFQNELKAFAFDLQNKNGTKVPETLRNSIPQEVITEPTNVWDRLEKLI